MVLNTQKFWVLQGHFNLRSLYGKKSVLKSPFLFKVHTSWIKRYTRKIPSLILQQSCFTAAAPQFTQTEVTSLHLWENCLFREKLFILFLSCIDEKNKSKLDNKIMEVVGCCVMVALQVQVLALVLFIWSCSLKAEQYPP